MGWRKEWYFWANAFQRRWKHVGRCQRQSCSWWRRGRELTFDWVWQHQLDEDNHRPCSWRRSSWFGSNAWRNEQQSSSTNYVTGRQYDGSFRWIFDSSESNFYSEQWYHGWTLWHFWRRSILTTCCWYVWWKFSSPRNWFIRRKQWPVWNLDAISRFFPTIHSLWGWCHSTWLRFQERSKLTWRPHHHWTFQKQDKCFTLRSEYVGRSSKVHDSKNETCYRNFSGTICIRFDSRNGDS